VHQEVVDRSGQPVEVGGAERRVDRQPAGTAPTEPEEPVDDEGHACMLANPRTADARALPNCTNFGRRPDGE
jgi:hypothetical protein